MFFKKIKKPISFLLLLLFIPTFVFAYSDYIIPGGENIGIKLNSNGILIVGTYNVNGKSLSNDAGLKVGDKITKVNDENVSNIEEMKAKIEASSNKNSVKITYVRNDISSNTDLKLYKEDDIYKTGLYVKDSILGVGTLTFIDPNTKKFGALGHEITEKSTGEILEIKDGEIYASDVTGIDASSNGSPGEKNANFHTEEVKGNIDENTTQGIFGKYLDELPNKKTYKVASKDDIKLGPAKILTVLSGSEINEYNIEITKINNLDSKNKNFVFKITDNILLEKTGGIVQGMSGSPIVQDDKIIGAVTHVVVNNPTNGYGIFIVNMLKEAEN